MRLGWGIALFEKPGGEVGHASWAGTMASGPRLRAITGGSIGEQRNREPGGQANPKMDSRDRMRCNLRTIPPRGFCLNCCCSSATYIRARHASESAIHSV